MITQIEALIFRCLRHVRQPLGPFRVLAGPNASGKSAFFDVVALLGRLVSDGLDDAIHKVRSLTAISGAQILIAAHSPVLLGSVPAAHVLCFAKTAEGATAIAAGRA